jgi:hypothetical protein
MILIYTEAYPWNHVPYACISVLSMTVEHKAGIPEESLIVEARVSVMVKKVLLRSHHF